MASAGQPAAAAAAAPPAAPERRRKEIYTFDAPWPLYGLAGSQRPGKEFRFALGSFIEEYNNKVQVIELDDDKNEFVVRGVFDHPYPTTKILWAPEAVAKSKDLLATAGDYLRLWTVQGDNEIRHEAIFNNNKHNEYCAPLTSFDWNFVDTSLVGTASIDTTVTVWDVATRKVRTHLIAHDREVHDIQWARSRDVFATVGAEGSLRMFDLRALEHSTIMYETNPDGPGTPLLRLSWNRLDANYIATFALDGTKTIVVDIRMPCTAAAELSAHAACVNALSWAPHSSSYIVTGGDDYQALIWDLARLPKPVEDPILAYAAEAEINNLVWSAALPEWVCVNFDNKMQMLRV